MILVIFLCLVLLMIFYLVFVYTEAASVTSNVQHTTQRVLDKYTSQMSTEIDSSIKNGHDYTDNLDSDLFEADLKQELNLTDDGCCYYSSSLIKYKLEDIKLSYDQQNHLQTVATIQVYYPFYFMGKEVIAARPTIQVRSDYKLKP